jgi:hypothetical protein
MIIPHYSIPDGYEELFDEIAGILEFDARLSRQDAESTALRIIYAMHLDTQNITTNDESGTP